MTDQQTRIFRDQILNALLAGDCSIGLDADCVLVFIRALGFPNATREEIISNLEYLTGRGFVVEVPSAHTRVIRRWRIADEGRRYLD